MASIAPLDATNIKGNITAPTCYPTCRSIGALDDGMRIMQEFLTN